MSTWSRTSRPWSFLALVLLCTLCTPARASQAQEPPPPPEEEQPAPAEPQPPAPTEPRKPDEPELQPGLPSAEEQGEGPEEEEEGVETPRPPEERNLPRLDVYFPEGELDLRINRLINKVFFEGQVKYNFIEGDITAFLRYRYYGYKRTTQFTVFDSIEFDDIDEDVKSDFDRVRGTLLLFQWPVSYNHRTFLLTEIDRISSNKVDTIDRLEVVGKTNTFVRLGYQLGTPDEGRSSAIAGETRARTERLFSAFREFGPGASTVTAAATYGFELGIGDFDYLKLELEVLKRFDITTRSFLVGRVRGGAIPYTADVEEVVATTPDDPLNLYDVPRSEFLRLDGRDNLKGLDERTYGTHLLLSTWEYFVPWFIEEKRDFLKLEWQNFYWVLYAGAGNAGFDQDIYTDFGSYIPDVGVGFESSLRLRKYRFFLSGIVAQALKGDGGVEARISVKSYR
ncbi:MAG TPA: hypothetical protein VL025_01275 [Thermoanaerobaculia bacterium]|nr:hypothetical protein [Thermoanaerobaculia bacterium]